MFFLFESINILDCSIDCFLKLSFMDFCLIFTDRFSSFCGIYFFLEILSYGAYSYLSFFRHSTCDFGEIATAFFGEGWYFYEDSFTIIGRIESEICIRNSFFDISNDSFIPRLNRNCLSVKRRYCSYISEWLT